MAVELLTKQDLAIFKSELLAELKDLLAPSAKAAKKWLKSYEVREMLGISPGTLQNMRINGSLNHTKLGGLIFYDYDDIAKLMDGGKKKPIKAKS